MSVISSPIAMNLLCCLPVTEMVSIAQWYVIDLLPSIRLRANVWQENVYRPSVLIAASEEFQGRLNHALHRSKMCHDL